MSPDSVRSDSLRSSTVRIDADLPLIDLGARSGLLWSRDGFTLAGIGEVLTIQVDRPGGFAAAGARLAQLTGENDLGVPGTGPVAFAALPFDPDRSGRLIVPRIVAGANQSGQRWLTVTVDRASEPEPSTDELLSSIQTLPAEVDDGVEPSEYTLRSVLEPRRWRDDVVDAARQRIRAGELDKVVMAREMLLTTDRPISAPAVVERLHSVFPTAALFLIDNFIGASPELLVARQGDVVRAHPLAGTAPRSSDTAVDQRRLGELLASEKDRWEHWITIDWLLDTLLPFCSYVDAEPEPSIVTLANVHHLGTKVEGRLSQPAAAILELVAALHPTPAVGGSPRKEALALIGELEAAERDRYAGPTGWVDGSGNGEFAVAIRSAQLGDREIRFFAGVGVVADSDPQSELEETRAKLKAMLGALIVP